MAGKSRDGFVPSESVFIVLAIVGIVLLAAFFPMFNIFDALNFSLSDGPGGGNGSSAEVLSQGEGLDIGLPGIGGLTTPPENTKISGSRNETFPNNPLFVAKSPERQYWRQTAYMTYLGTSWEQSTTSQNLEFGVPNDQLTRDAQEIEYQIELLTDTKSLPTAWQPEEVIVQNQTGTVDLRASTVGGIQSRDALVEGTTYIGISSKPPASAENLKQAEETYPQAIGNRYTQLPDTTPDRVTEFTDNLTTDAESEYETAIVVRDWLRSNKEYSLNTSIDPEKPIADQFIFEAERGYCQHFATSMAVMLRSQDIPARYVVGYSSGQQIGADEYLITSADGHAWVEVYFADVGWVTFEPTTASQRDVDPEPPQPPYNISLNRSVVAGASITIHVSKNQTPVVGAPIYVEGERIDWTDSNGNATTTLPYVQNVTVVVRPPGSESRKSMPVSASNSITTPGNLPAPSIQNQRRYDLGGLEVGMPLSTRHNRESSIPKKRLLSQSLASENPFQVFQSEALPNQTAKNYTAATNVTIDLPQSITLGDTVELQALITDVPMRNGTISVNGEPVGRTDQTGEFALNFANVTLGQNNVSAQKGDAKGTTSVFVTQPETDQYATNVSANKTSSRSINISVSPPYGFPLPLGPATVNVTNSSGPVEGTLITVEGAAVGQTDENGTVAIRFPISQSVTVSATGPTGETAARNIENLYRNAAVTLGAVGIIGLVIVLILRRWGTPDGRVRNRLLAWFGIILDVFLRVPQGIASSVKWLRAQIREKIERLGEIPVRELIAKRQIITVDQLASRVRGFLIWAQRVFARLHDALLVRKDSVSAEAATKESRDEGFGLKDVWQEFLSVVQPPSVATSTPGEIGRYAIRNGFPKKPVQSFIHWYRGAIYGPDSERPSHMERAKEHLEALKNGVEEE